MVAHLRNRHAAAGKNAPLFISSFFSSISSRSPRATNLPRSAQRDNLEKRLGQPPRPDDKYDDIEDVAKVTSLPDEAMHRPVDKIVLAAAAPSIQTAIVSPPCIFGPGRGPANTRSIQMIQVYDMVRFSLREGFAPVVGTGLAEWDHVHVHDLSDLMVRLAETAAQDGDGAGLARGPKVFGERRYFFCEAGSHRWGDVARCKLHTLTTY